MKKIYYLIMALFMLNLFDYLTTMNALNNGAFEINPIANFFIIRNTLLHFKLVVLGILSVYLLIRAKRDLIGKLRVTKLLYFANIYYILILLSNLMVNYNAKIS